MSDSESIQSILGESPFVTGESPAPPAVETKPETPAEVKPEVDAKPDRVRDESGKFAKAEEKPAEKPAEKPKLSSAEVAAIIDERRKRQEAEQRYADLLAKTQKPEQAPSVFDNEAEAINARVAEGTRGLRETLYKLSIKAARAAYKDFGEAESAFAEAMERDPRLIVGLRQADDPGEYIYTAGIHVRELADVGGDLMKYREKVSAVSQSKIDDQAKQIAALTSELETLKKSQAELAAVPRSLNGLPSTPAKAGDGDDDINSIVRFK